ncbi:hypothetical protein COV82_06395 [Candidatus Peregrinibacteria bacterium CG11_big_fil_rev_8_21_14_0_20_46_8]|nr:MAG: hypothetical protein COV82_06395 [Candidatus Peregrinibacteria bacterium CG11_big_fil_rev_8_21_14_0_20_46_8]
MDNRSKEHIKGPISPEKKQEGPQKPKEMDEVKERASEVVGAGVEGAEAGTAETVETGAERPSERIREGAGEEGSSGGGTAATQGEEETIEEIRARLLKALPPQKEMVRQIKRTLFKQEKELTKRMHKLQRRSHTTAWELTNVVRRLRQIQEYFSILAHATYEVVKNLWLKIVHGV